MVRSGAALHMSAEHFPVVIVTWFGSPSADMVPEYIGWLTKQGQRAADEDTKLVLLGDTAAIEVQPGPEMRRAMVRAVRDFADAYPQFLGGATVVSNPLVRTALRMALMLLPKSFDFKPARTVEQALEHAFGLLDAAQVARPPRLKSTDYRRPVRPTW